MFALSNYIDGRSCRPRVASVARTKANMKTLHKRIELRCRVASARAAAAMFPSAPDETNAGGKAASFSQAPEHSQWINERSDLADYRKDTCAQLTQTQ